MLRERSRSPRRTDADVAAGSPAVQHDPYLIPVVEVPPAESPPPAPPGSPPPAPPEPAQATAQQPEVAHEPPSLQPFGVQQSSAGLPGPQHVEGSEVLLETTQELEEAAKMQKAVDFREGYFKPTLGLMIEGNDCTYCVVDSSPLGVGMFSAVYSCADGTGKLVALKVVRRQDHFRRYAEKEVAMLQRVKSLEDQDVEGSRQVLMLKDHFIYKAKPEHEFLCMAFDRLKDNLRTFGKQPLDKVIMYSCQLFLALRFLHETVGVVHCDIKPDNLLLRLDGRGVKLCDFGTARASNILQDIDELVPLFYRAPEIFIGAPRGRKIDLWAAGCTIYELIVGRILFRACNTLREVLESIMQIRGPLPQSALENGRNMKLYFDEQQRFVTETGLHLDLASFKKKDMHAELVPHADFGKVKKVTAQEQAKLQLSRLIGRTTVVGAAMKRSGGLSEGEKKLKMLAEVVDQCMDIDPAKRATAAACCAHSVFKDVVLPPVEDVDEEAKTYPVPLS